MTPANDKTLRGIFRPVRIGHDEWNDRRDYRVKHECEVRLSDTTSYSPVLFSILSSLPTHTILHQTHSKTVLDENNEDYLMSIIERLFPESNLFRWHVKMTTFGYGIILGDSYTECVRCGKNIWKIEDCFNTELCRRCNNTIEIGFEGSEELNNGNILQ